VSLGAFPNLLRVVPALLVLGLAGCDLNLPGKPDEKKQEKWRPEGIKKFEPLFAQNCAGCHGKDGKLGAAPPLNDPLFLALVEENTLRMVIDKGREEIAEGRKGALMPAFGGRPSTPVPLPGKALVVKGNLTKQQIEVLVKGLRKEWGKLDKAPKDAPPYEADEKAGNKAAGAKVFQRACASCHGKDGAGGEKTAGAVHDPALLATLSDQVLRRLIITGRPDLGMPDYADKTGRGEDFQPLTSQDVADLVALLASWRTPRAAAE
jgi:mono/diheme cytochrome c family protein